MCDSSSLTGNKSLHRVNSSGEHSDTQSEFIGGNLNFHSFSLPRFNEEEDLSSDDEEEENLMSDNAPITLEKYAKADLMLCEKFGTNILEETANKTHGSSDTRSCI